jgi:hypothetical protein
VIARALITHTSTTVPSSFPALALSALRNTVPSAGMAGLFKGVKRVVHVQRTAGSRWKPNGTSPETILESQESGSEEISADDGTRGFNRVKKKKHHRVNTFEPQLVPGAHHEVQHGGLNHDYYYHHNLNDPSQGQAQPTGQQLQYWPPSNTQSTGLGAYQAPNGSPSQPPPGQTNLYSTQGLPYGRLSQDLAVSSGGQQSQYNNANQQQSGPPWQNDNQYGNHDHAQLLGNNPWSQESSSFVQQQSDGGRPLPQSVHSSPLPSTDTYFGTENAVPQGFSQPGRVQTDVGMFDLSRPDGSRPEFGNGSNLGRAMTMPASTDSWSANGSNAFV